MSDDWFEDLREQQERRAEPAIQFMEMAERAFAQRDAVAKALEQSRDAIASLYFRIDNPNMPARLAAAWGAANRALGAVGEGKQSPNNFRSTRQKTALKSLSQVSHPPGK